MPLASILDLLFSSAGELTSEDDCAEHIIVPLLQHLGHSSISRKVSIPIPSGENKLYRQADLVVRMNNDPRLVVETKRLSHRLDEEDTSQVLAYAELLGCRYAVL